MITLSWRFFGSQLMKGSPLGGPSHLVIANMRSKALNSCLYIYNLIFTPYAICSHFSCITMLLTPINLDITPIIIIIMVIVTYIAIYISIYIYIHTYPLSWLQLHPQVPPATDSPQLWPAWCRPWRWDAAGAWTRDAPARLCSFARCSPRPLDVAGRCERERNDDDDVFECFWGFRLRGSKENVWRLFLNT